MVEWLQCCDNGSHTGAGGGMVTVLRRYSFPTMVHNFYGNGGMAMVELHTWVTWAPIEFHRLQRRASVRTMY